MDISQREYRSLDAVSRSDLMELRKSPKHYHFKTEHHINEDSKALVFGSLVHKLVLEPYKFGDEFAIAPEIDRRTKEGKAAYAAFISKHSGKTVVSLEDYDVACAMAEQVRKHPEASQLLYSGNPKYEQSFVWIDDETGTRCKVRPDCLNKIGGQKYIIDYKTTDSCQDGHFERSAKKYGYQLQAGMYTEGLFYQTYEDYKFVFIAQEKTEPYAVRIYDCDESYIDFGTDEFHELLNRLRECTESGQWSGYERATLTEGDY